MFEHLSNLDPNARTAWCELPMIAPGAAVSLRFAGEGNAGYFNAMLARAGKRARKIATRGGAFVDAALLDENRREDRELYPAHVIADWRGIQDTQRQTVECTLEARKEFCAKLPAWIFDRIRDFASRPERFMVAGEETPPDALELAGNS